MKIKTIVLASVLCALCTVPVFAADDTSTQKLTDINANEGVSTDITGVVSTAQADVSYIIEIPATLDFGTLQQPRKLPTDGARTDKIISAQIKPIKIEGLVYDTDNPVNNEGVVVSVANGTEYKPVGVDPSAAFKIYGQDATNTNSALTYDLYNVTKRDTAGAAVTSAPIVPTADGPATVGAFTQNAVTAGQVFDLDLRLDQNQLVGQDLSAISGKYKGNLKFTSAIRSITNVNTPAE